MKNKVNGTNKPSKAQYPEPIRLAAKDCKCTEPEFLRTAFGGASERLPKWPKNPSRYFKIKKVKGKWNYQVSGPVLKWFERYAQLLGVDEKTAVNNWFCQSIRKLMTEPLRIEITGRTRLRLERIAAATGETSESVANRFIQSLTEAVSNGSVS